MSVEPAPPPLPASQACSHAVHFYERDDDAASAVAPLVADGLRAGQPVVVIASPAHRELFVRRLQALDIDVEAVRVAGTLTILDAARTLARFIVAGAPDAEAFRRVVSSIIEASAARGTQTVKVRVYGEMVDLLWQ